jgi:hypothetical protein
MRQTASNSPIFVAKKVFILNEIKQRIVSPKKSQQKVLTVCISNENGFNLSFTIRDFHKEINLFLFLYCYFPNYFVILSLLSAHSSYDVL